MAQTRLYFSVPRTASAAIFASLETEFEDDGLPFAVSEQDDGTDEVSVYGDGDLEALEIRIRRATGKDGAALSIAHQRLDDVDWVKRSLEGLKPVRAGRFFVHGAHDRGKRRAGDIGIEIEAGLAFGTGHHGTTAGCLETLTAVVRRERPRNALDLGAGSAVLAVALAKLARIPVLATDIDPVAVEVAAANVKLNGVGALVETTTATGFQHSAFARRGPFDLVVANILARPLMMLAPQMARHVAAGGSVVLSGILERQRDAVLAAYGGQRFRHVHTLHREGWVTIHLKR